MSGVKIAIMKIKRTEYIEADVIAMARNLAKLECDPTGLQMVMVIMLASASLAI
jgi:hypothetical protein